MKLTIILCCTQKSTQNVLNSPSWSGSAWGLKGPRVNSSQDMYRVSGFIPSGGCAGGS